MVLRRQVAFQWGRVLSPIPVYDLCELRRGLAYPLGFGVALVEWRIAATPEIVNRIASNMNSRLRGFLRNLAISLVPGLILLDLGDYVTRPHFLGFSPSIGFPLAYSQIITSRCSPGGCLYTFDPLNIVLDYFLWALLSLVIITSIRWALTLLRNARQLPGKV